MMKSDQVDVVKVVTIFVMSVSLPIFADGPVDQGERLFNQNCVFCHQQDAIGTPGRRTPALGCCPLRLA